jgi:tRNA dimethylallyltransferase
MREMMKTGKILIFGVTAVGKGMLAFEMARRLGGEILSVDSMKVYRRMDIGTAKPPPERRQQVRYHMIDIVEPSEAFSAGLFLDKAIPILEQTRQRGTPVVAVGGTALYIKALLYGLFDGPGADASTRRELQEQARTQGLQDLYQQLCQVDPEAACRIHANDAKRIIRALEVFRLTGRPISGFQTQFDPGRPLEDWTIVGLRRDKAEESHRMNLRVKRMMDSGLVEEVKALLAEPQPLGAQARSAIGYAEIIDYLAGNIRLEGAVERIKRNTRRLAKGQRTWFKTFPCVHWLDIQPGEALDQTVERAMGLWG